MHFVRVTDDSTPDEITEAIGHLRDKRKTCGAAIIRTEIDEDVDELLELLHAQTCN